MNEQNTRPQPSAEPVAWMYQWRNDEPVYLSSKRDWADYPNNAGWTETPLYPASALEAARREGLQDLPDMIEIYRAIKRMQPPRTLVAIAQTIAALLPKENTDG